MESSSKTFPISIRFKHKICLFPPICDVFVHNQKITQSGQLEKVERIKFQEKYLDISKKYF